MEYYTYTVSMPGQTTTKIDVCSECHDKLGLPTTPSKRNVRMNKNDGKLYREHKCFGCGGTVSSSKKKLARPFDGNENISPTTGTERDANTVAMILNMADNLDVFVTTDAPTESVPVSKTDDGSTVAKVVRQIPGSESNLHIMVMNEQESGREEMEARCESLCRLLSLNGWDGAPRPNEGQVNDWEIWAVKNNG